MTAAEYQRLEREFIAIRDERGTARNTAVRIGTAFLDLLRLSRLGEFDEIIFNQVLNKPEFLQGLIALGTIILGKYEEGLQGGIITPEGVAELKSLWLRESAVIGDGLPHYDEAGRVIPALEVKGDSTFSGSLSSEDFISGFFGGLGWGIQKKEFVNAAGVTEYKYTLEVDNAVIRNTLRVFEMIICQLLGENANRFFSDMMEVDHYDAETGRVMLKTKNGRLYNPFRVGDIIMAQQYNGDPSAENDWYVTKAYELHITKVGVGSTAEGEDRLDWVEFDKFASQMEDQSPEKCIKEWDTFVRADNDRNENRKGLVTIMAVGEGTPYLDIVYGMKTDPDNSLKGRLGRLDGIYHHLFGWLKGFGEYMINAYIVGDVRLRRTGMSLDTSLEILQGRMASRVAETIYTLTEGDNFLSNASFTELNEDGSFKDWTVSNDEISIYAVGGVPVVSSVGLLSQVGSAVKTQIVDGNQVLHIVNASVSQSHSAMKTVGTHRVFDTDGTSHTEEYDIVGDKLYLSLSIKVLKEGTLTIGFPSDSADGAIGRKTVALERDGEWKEIKWSGTWDGVADFLLQFTGECYVGLLTLTQDPLSDFKEEYSTQIIQTSRNIAFVATRTTANETNIARLEITAQQIQSTVEQNYTDLDGRVIANASRITQTAAEIRSEVSSVESSLDGKISENRSSITQTAAQIRSEVSAIESDLDGKISENRSSITQTAAQIRSEVSGYVETLDGKITTAESHITQTAADIRAEVKSTTDTIAGNLATTDADLRTTISRVGTLELTDTSLSGRISSVEATTSTHSTQIGNLSGDLDDLAGDVSSINGKVTTVTSRVSALELSDSSLTTSVSNLQTSVSTHTGEISTLKANVTSLQQTDTSIGMRVTAAESKMEKLSGAWEQGGLVYSAGKELEEIMSSSSFFIRYSALVSVTSATSCLLNEDYEVRFFWFNASKKSIGASSFYECNKYNIVKPSVPGTAVYAAIVINHVDGTALSPSDVNETGVFLSNDKIKTEGYIGVMIDNGITNATISADKIDFTFTQTCYWWAKSGNTKTKVMQLDTNGDLHIIGQLIEGDTKIKETVTVGTNTYRMEIYADEDRGTISKAAGIRGKASNTEVMDIGFNAYDNKVVPYIRLGVNAAGNSYSVFRPGYINMIDYDSGVNMAMSVNSGYFMLMSPSWPASDTNGLPNGSVYKDSNGFLKVK